MSPPGATAGWAPEFSSFCSSAHTLIVRKLLLCSCSGSVGTRARATSISPWPLWLPVMKKRVNDTASVRVVLSHARKSLSRTAMLFGGCGPVKSAQTLPAELTTTGFPMVTPLAVGVSTSTATVSCAGFPSLHASSEGRNSDPTMKWAPPSIETTLGSPDHCWSGFGLRRPTRSVNERPPSVEYPTPVRDACSRLPCRNANPVASFHAAMTWPDADAAIAVSLCPPSRSSFTSAASTFVPMLTERPATFAPCDGARGGFSHAVTPCDTYFAFRCCATTWRNVGFVVAFADDDAALFTTSATTETHPNRRISASLRRRGPTLRGS